MRNFLLIFPLLLLAGDAFAEGEVAPAVKPLPAAFRLPEATTVEDKIRLLFALKRELPVFLNDTQSYGFNSMAVLDDQQRLLGELAKMPGYAEALEQQGAFRDITIRATGNRQVVHMAADPAKVDAWKKRLTATYREHPSFLKDLAEAVQSVKQDNADGLLAAAIKQLEGPLKGEAFKQPGAEAKLAFLHAHPEIPPAVKAALPRVEEVLRWQSQIEKLTELAIVLQPEPGQWPSAEEAGRRLAALTEADLNLLPDFAHYVKPRLEAANKQLHAQKANLAVRVSVAEKIGQNAKSAMTPVELGTDQVTSQELVLKQLRPAAGIFRACAGNDCSTKYSFAAPNNPSEMVFNLTDAQGQNKGYVEMARVEVDGKPALYVSSINGPKISPSDVDLILNGLYQERAALGVESILLPNEKNVAALMNYAGITGRVNALIKGKPKRQLRFPDAAFREKIEDFESRYLQMDYDSMETNRTAVLFAPGDGPDLQVELRHHPLVPLKLDRSISRLDIISFVLENRESLRQDGLESQLANELRAPAQFFKEFSDLLMNYKGLPVKEFDAQVREKLAQILPAAELESKTLPAQVMAAGRFECPDAFTPPHLSETAAMVRQLLGREIPRFFHAQVKLFLAMPNEENLDALVAALTKKNERFYQNDDVKALRKAVSEQRLEGRLRKHLEAMSKTGQADTRARLLRVLEMFPEQGYPLEIHERLLADADPGVRREAASALELVRDSGERTRLVEKAALDQEGGVLSAVLPWAEGISDPQKRWQILNRFLESTDEGVREHAWVKILPSARVDAAEKLRLVEKALSDPYARMRRLAAAHIQSAPSLAQRKELLEKVLNDKSDDVRSQAALAVGWLESEEEKKAVLMRLARDKKKSPVWVALEQVSQLHQDANRAALIEAAFAQGDASLGAHAVEKIVLVRDADLRNQLLDRASKHWSHLVTRKAAKYHDCAGLYANLREE